MTKMYHGGKTRRRNRRSMRGGANSWSEYFKNGWDSIIGKAKDVLQTGYSSVGTGLNSVGTSFQSDLNSFTGPPAQPYQPPLDQQSYQTSPDQQQGTYGGGKRRRKKGGFQAYYPPATWNNMSLSPYPAAVGGTRKKRGGFQAYYPPDTWSSMYPYPAAVGGKKRRTHRRK